MASRSSDLDDFETEIKIQTEDHTLTWTNGQNGQENQEAFGSVPSHSPSWSLARKPKPHWPKTQYCLEIHIISTEDDKAVPPPPHTWQVLIVEDMVWEGRPGLMEAVVTGPGQAVLFYGWQLLGEGLSLGEVRDATFTLSGIIAWVGKQVQLNAKPVSLGEGRWLITHTIAEGNIKPMEPGHPHSIPPALMPFSFHHQDLSPQSANLPVTAKWWEVPQLGSQQGQQEWGWALQRGWNRGQRQQELWVAPPQSLLLSSDHGLESDRSTVSTSSSVSSMSERSGGSRHPHHGRCLCREPGGHMKINLSVFKDEDTKDAVTYQSWHWDLAVYHCAGCWDCTLLPYTIHSLQSYPGELVRNSGMDITLDDILTILDEHYNIVKALDVLNQELFQLHMGKTEDSVWLVNGSIKTPADSHSVIPRMLFPRLHYWIEAWSLLQWTS